MLWANERIDIGRPRLESYAKYTVGEMYRSGVEDPDDRPTVGTLWVYRKVCKDSYLFICISSHVIHTLIVDLFFVLQPRWASGTTRRVYTQFVEDFDQLTPDRVRWTPYTNQALMDRAPYGMTQLCTRDGPY